MPFWNPFLKVRLQKHQLYNLPNVIKVCPCTLGTSHIPYHGQQDGTQLFWKSSNALSSRVVMSNTYFDFQRCPSLDISYTYGHEFSSLWHPSACSALWLHSFHSLSTVGIWNSSVPRSTLLHFQAYEHLFPLPNCDVTFSRKLSLEAPKAPACDMTYLLQLNSILKINLPTLSTLVYVKLRICHTEGI